MAKSMRLWVFRRREIDTSTFVSHREPVLRTRIYPSGAVHTDPEPAMRGACFQVPSMGLAPGAIQHATLTLDPEEVPDVR